MRSSSVVLALSGLSLLGCAHGKPAPLAAPTPVATEASAEEVSRLWHVADGQFRTGKWNAAQTNLERITLELPPGDTLIPIAHFRLAECYFAQKNNLQATREFRRVSDDTPNHPLAPEALLRAGDAFADLWRRPELDPSYGQSARATYQELLNRYPDTAAAAKAKARMAELDESFAIKSYKAALFYTRLKAYDSAILYLRDLVATYPRTAVAPDALLKLIEVYSKVGYKEDVVETCGYLRRFHPGTPRTDEVCPPAQ
jgi:outer membrane protein assembly factor BamD